ncbi:hypothetical protein VZT92_020196 [Zoarces viviparus]|uniref:Uncharacterized protein n=1 Tax=Zoarces viviparus TaxID=48416 RepID=A0AAW1EDK7_ZOAVI
MLSVAKGIRLCGGPSAACCSQGSPALVQTKGCADKHSQVLEFMMEVSEQRLTHCSTDWPPSQEPRAPLQPPATRKKGLALKSACGAPRLPCISKALRTKLQC